MAQAVSSRTKGTRRNRQADGRRGERFGPGQPHPNGLELEMGAGERTVDLTGDYARGFDASIEGGIGEASVLVPSEVGVRVRVEGDLGEINAKDFRREGNSYVND